MFGWLYHRMIARMERRYGYDATYLHEVIDAAPEAARRFGRMQTAGKWRGDLPLEAFHAAALGGALHEDCGPCVQIVTDMALEAGVDAALIADLLRGEAAGTPARLALDYARALLAGDHNLDALRGEAVDRWGQTGLIALTLTAMTARNFPVLKRAMGHARECRRISVAGDQVPVLAKAA